MTFETWLTGAFVMASVCAAVNGQAVIARKSVGSPVIEFFGVLLFSMAWPIVLVIAVGMWIRGKLFA